jgi:hypothetical protein
MRKYLVVMVAATCLGIGSTSAVRAQGPDWRSQQQQLKLQQKRERNALNLQQRNIKRSWKNARISSATRAQTKHQMQRATRDLKQRQRDAMQDLKDRQKAFQQNQRAYAQ